MDKRLYSQFEITKADDSGDMRTIEGVASSINPDKVNDIVEPKGAQYSLPMPFLWQHQHDQPIGHVTSVKSDAETITFKAEVAKIENPGRLKDRVDEAWDSIKSGLVRGISIGFSPIEYSLLESGGVRFTEYRLNEISAVTIPANADASVTAIKKLDMEHEKAALGAPESGVSESVKPKLKEKKEMNFQEQIDSAREARQVHVDKMLALVEKSNESGEVMSDADQEAFSEAETAVEQIDGQINRLEKMQKINGAASKPVEKTARGASVANVGGPGMQVKVKPDNLPKGIAFSRYAMCLAAANGSRSEALQIAQERYKDMPQLHTVLKAAVAAGTTTNPAWAGSLTEYTDMASEFIEYLWPKTVIGQIGVDKFRNVPFNISMARQTAAGDANWVGQGKPKPLTQMAFDRVQLGFAKLATIAVLTDEQVQFSSPASEALVRDDLAMAVGYRMDMDFLDPAKAAVANVSPASVTNGVAATAASGTTAQAFKTDLLSMHAAMKAATPNMSAAGSYLIMSEMLAATMGMMENALGNAEFPGLTADGGSVAGHTVITTENLPAADGIYLIKPSEIFLASDGGVTLDVSREASLEMDDAPTQDGAVGTGAALVSLWQNNMIGLRAERYVNWQTRRAGAAQYITGAAYAI